MEEDGESILLEDNYYQLLNVSKTVNIFLFKIIFRLVLVQLSYYCCHIIYQYCEYFNSFMLKKSFQKKSICLSSDCKFLLPFLLCCTIWQIFRLNNTKLHMPDFVHFGNYIVNKYYKLSTRHIKNIFFGLVTICIT